MTKSYQISKDMDIETMPHTMYFTGNSDTVTKINQIPALAIIQGVAAIGRMMIKGINALVDVKRASSFNNAIKLINENV